MTKPIRNLLLEVAENIEQSDCTETDGVCFEIERVFDDEEGRWDIINSLLDEFENLFRPSESYKNNKFFWLYNRKDTKEVNRNRRMYAVLLLREMLKDLK